MKPPDDTRRHRLRAARAIIARDAEAEPGRVKADINVTPLVDVVLVLLIIFMVVTPLIASGVAVDLPRTLHHSRKPDDGKDIIVSITADERFYVGSKRLGRVKDLVSTILREKRRFPDKTIYLKGDARVGFGAVRRAMAALHDADINDVILGTEALEEAQK